MLLHNKVTKRIELKIEYEVAENNGFETKQIWKQSTIWDRHEGPFCSMLAREKMLNWKRYIGGLLSDLLSMQYDVNCGWGEIRRSKVDIVSLAILTSYSLGCSDFLNRNDMTKILCAYEKDKR